jgi:hypothetical protein
VTSRKQVHDEPENRNRARGRHPTDSSPRNGWPTGTNPVDFGRTGMLTALNRLLVPVLCEFILWAELLIAAVRRNRVRLTSPGRVLLVMRMKCQAIGVKWPTVTTTAVASNDQILPAIWRSCVSGYLVYDDHGHRCPLGSCRDHWPRSPAARRSRVLFPTGVCGDEGAS